MSWWLSLIIVALGSGITHFYRVSEPAHVCWDETHFGKMASWYINQTFFFDVHPPLGKMLIALSGYLTGYDGKFPFDKPGDSYKDVNYIGMRAFCTLLGTAVAPFAFLIVWEMTQSLNAANMAALFIISDVGLLTLTRYILLDPILLFFMMASIYCMAKFNSQFFRPFTKKWWFWLALTGVNIACCVSVKFVGLFTVLLVGLNTVTELWKIMGDLKKPFAYTMRHFFARVLCLIILPLAVYIFFFYIHLAVLRRSGNGDGFYSSGFQTRLVGNTLYNTSMPRDVAYGAIISLKNHRTGGGYLHSHWHLYPEGYGAKQQQVTTYTHKDDNNKWLIKPYNADISDGNVSVSLVAHGDLIRLEHVQTRRNLHSHREQAPLTKKHYQVTGYGDNGVGDANDVWKILILGGTEGEVVKTVTSRLKFVHYLQHCVLTTTGKQLPKWGYEQQEVTCNANLRDKSAIWNVEENIHSKLPNVSFEVYGPNFIERFVESHAVMIQGNAGLKAKEGDVTSRPWQWPFNYRGQFFSASEYKIYLLGNPVIWWANLFFLVSFVIVYVYNAVKWKRSSSKKLRINVKHQKLLDCALWLFLSWLLHYVPFYAMGRILYFHHYFPALIFSTMISGVMLSYFLEVSISCFKYHAANTFYHSAVGTIYSAIIYSFYLFSPLTYGIPVTSEPNGTMYHLKWMDSWEF